MTTAYKVLIVDDDAAMRDSLSTLFHKAGWVAEVLPSAAKVAALISETAFDVILSDMRMQGASGLDLLQSLADTAHPPFILISAHGDIPLAVEAMQARGLFLFEKPFDPRKLLLAAQHAAEQHRLTHRNRQLEDGWRRCRGSTGF